MSFTKKGFAIELSRLKVFDTPKEKLEQYPTDSEVAADILWYAANKGDIKDKEIIDYGCGTGILGIGCVLLGAKKVTFVDIDITALTIAKENYKKITEEYEVNKIEVEFIESDILNANINAQTIIQNPPFGIKDSHADKKFLEHSFKQANIIYSLHKTESKKFLEAICKDNKFRITNTFDYDFPLKQTLPHHKRKIRKIPVTCFRLERIA